MSVLPERLAEMWLRAVLNWLAKDGLNPLFFLVSTAVVCDGNLKVGDIGFCFTRFAIYGSCRLRAPAKCLLHSRLA